MNFLEPQEKEQKAEAIINMVRQSFEPEERAMITRDPFDPAPLIKLFEMYHVQVDKMANVVQGLAVVDDKTNDNAVLLTSQAKQLSSAIEKKRVELKDPYLRITSVLDSETKGLKDRLVLIQKHINSLITPFLQKKEELKRAAERKAQAERDRIQKELDDKAQAEREQAAKDAREKAEAEGLSKKQAEEAAQQAAAMVEEAPVVVMDAPAETKVKTEAGTARIKEEWSFEILNCAGLPTAAYIARNDQVKAALSPWVSAQVKAGIREISGVRIFKAAKLETRAKQRGNSTGTW